MYEPIAVASGDGLDSVISTAQLGERSSRPADYAAESAILASLAQGMTHSPELILQSLAQAALTSCRAGSAGISLIEEDGAHFRWRALKGELAAHLGDTTPRSFSPCGTVVDRNAVHLFSYLERHFKYFASMQPTIVEALLVPFSFEGKPVGTIWVMTHDDAHRFDAEDARLIGNPAGSPPPRTTCEARWPMPRKPTGTATNAWTCCPTSCATRSRRCSSSSTSWSMSPSAWKTSSGQAA
jgi:hypothetical protein